MKNIIFTFDDGRHDQYINAAKILNEKGLCGTFYVTTGYIMGDLPLDYFISSQCPMSKDEVLKCQKMGMEIGAHGHMHKNSIDDIYKSISLVKEWTKTEEIGFASPSSEICEKNINEYAALKKDLLYIRTGRQLHRNNVLYIAFFIINQVIKSKYIFWGLNKRYITTSTNEMLFKSIAIRRDTPQEHVIYFLSKLNDGETAILLFHGVMEKNNEYYNKDVWTYDIDGFCEICDYIKQNEFNVCTLKDFVNATI